MKKLLTLEELLVNTGSHIESQITRLYSSYNKDVTIVDILENKDIPLGDKGYILYNFCELTIEQQTDLACILGKAVAPIFNERFPDDNSVNECWQAIDDFKNNLISKEQLLEKRKTVEKVIYYKIPFYYASRSSYNAASAVYYAISDIIFCVNNATYHAIDAANVHEDPVYIKLLNQLMIDFANNN